MDRRDPLSSLHMRSQGFQSGQLEEKMAARMLGQQARQISTSAIRPAAKLVKPPIQVYGVEGRYATALFSAASKQKKLDQVEQELGKVNALIKDPKISSIVMNPHVKRSLKQKTFHDALAKAKVSPITMNLINVLSDNGRLTLTGDVITAFGKMMSAHRGEVICSVTTAQPLDPANLAELKLALNGFLQKGETIKMETKMIGGRFDNSISEVCKKRRLPFVFIGPQEVDCTFKKSDSSILGGMIVSIGDKYVDMSTKTKIQKLTKLMRES